MKRDDFSKGIRDILAGRVGHNCSNPKCRQPTIGPNHRADKTTSIGVAAHISAASPGGPRFDAELSSEERQGTKNGIWLCSNCAALIDKDVSTYTVESLLIWKSNAEWRQWAEIEGQARSGCAPFLECDLVWTGGQRSPRGMSLKNPIEVIDGRPTMVIGLGYKPIIHWELMWKHELIIYNNSTRPAYNLSVEVKGDKEFGSLSRLERVNNLIPHDKRILTAKSSIYLEGRAEDVDPILKAKIPTHLHGLTLTVSCEDEERKAHTFMAKIMDGQLINIRPWEGFTRE